MAKIGLKHIVYKATTASGILAKAVQADIAINLNNEKLFADDELAEIDNSFVDGTITLGTSDLTDAVQAILLGHSYTDGELIANSDDIAPYVGIGFYGKRKVDGTAKYRAIWMPKVMFGEPEDTHATRGQNTTFQSHTIVGTIFSDASGNWRKSKIFDTAAEAEAYIDDLAGVVVQCTEPVASVDSGSYDAAQSVTLTAGAGETIYYTTNGTTPSATNGTEYTTEITLSDSCALRAIAIKAEQNDSEIAEYEYIITIT
jgi:phi13 family phage major tail protein